MKNLNSTLELFLQEFGVKVKSFFLEQGFFIELKEAFFDVKNDPMTGLADGFDTKLNVYAKFKKMLKER